MDPVLVKSDSYPQEPVLNQLSSPSYRALIHGAAGKYQGVSYLESQ